jgi:predicted extracellular nuclease
VLGFDFSLYRIQPTGPADYTAANPRPAAPAPVGGGVRVAAMNTLNFFLTLDYPTGDPLDNKCGPAQNVECRGADSDQPAEFTRQRDKLLAALAGLGADVIGLNEIENTTGVEPLANIVSGLPGYAYIDTGTIGTDAIRVGLIYKPASVAPIGEFQILDSSDDPRFLDTKSRPVLAQTFEVLATGARFTVAVNHLKSKGSDCLDVGDPDTGDGQGNCNLTRKAAAQALVDWLATDPTGSGDPDFLIIGDLNSYAKEDPIDAILAGPDDTPGTSDDYRNLVDRYLGPHAYSYVFDGQSGYLDHALSSPHLTPQVAGVAEWHLNADEPDVLDYDTTFKPPAQDALYEPNGFRSSDHDPVVVGLGLRPTYDDLCRLTRRLVTKPGVAESLCGKLEAAEAAAARGNANARDGVLKAYRNQVDAQTGKSISVANAAQLKALSLVVTS